MYVHQSRREGICLAFKITDLIPLNVRREAAIEKALATRAANRVRADSKLRKF